MSDRRNMVVVAAIAIMTSHSMRKVSESWSNGYRGAISLLLAGYPELRKEVAAEIRKRRSALRKIKEAA